MKSGTSTGAMTTSKIETPGRYDIVSLTFLRFADRLIGIRFGPNIESVASMNVHCTQPFVIQVS
jgi:hypothetical protein